MATGKRRGLGRGLDALLGDSVAETVSETQESTATAVSLEQAANTKGLQTVAIELIERGRYQPRTHFDQQALETLAESIRQQGILQPLVLRQHGQQYELIAGERRWRAAQLAGLQTVPAVVREMDNETAAAIALIENIQREDLGPLEEAHGFKRLIDEFGLTHQQVANVVSRSRAAVTNLLRLLELDDTVKRLLDNSEIQMGHARAILALPLNKQADIAKQVAEQGLSVRQTEKLIQQQLLPAPSIKPQTSIDPNIQHLEQDLAERLGAKVTIQHQSSGKGKLLISYTSSDELEGILTKIKA